MAPQGIVAAIVVGLIAGWLASFIVGGGGLLKYIIWGVLGSFVGGFLLPLTGLKINTGIPFIDTVLVSAVGAIVLVFAARLIS